VAPSILRRCLRRGTGRGDSILAAVLRAGDHWPGRRVGLPLSAAWAASRVGDRGTHARTRWTGGLQPISNGTLTFASALRSPSAALTLRASVARQSLRGEDRTVRSQPGGSPAAGGRPGFGECASHGSPCGRYAGAKRSRRVETMAVELLRQGAGEQGASCPGLRLCSPSRSRSLCCVFLVSAPGRQRALVRDRSGL
jgi:hypothetical protein